MKPFILTVNPPRMTGFLSPLAKTTFNAGATIPVKFVLTSANGTPISSSVSATLASAGIVTATLAGGGINPQPTSCTWNTAALYFQCNIKSPSTLLTGPTNPYTITASVISTAGTAITIPVLGAATNPETIYFK